MRTKALQPESKEPMEKAQALQRPAVSMPQPIGVAATLLSLQCSHGNRYVQRLLRSRRMQAKLTISEPGDQYEQEADRVAETVMRMPEPIGSGGVAVSGQVKDGHTQPVGSADAEHLHRQTMDEEMPEEEEETLQAKEVSGETPEVTPELEARVNNARGSGQPLPESVRAFFEPRFGYDFGGVRVHTDGQAVDSARSVKARAYTLGQDIVFGSGQYAPETPAGKQLLAHELTHVVQQSSSNGNNVGRSKEKRGLSPISAISRGMSAARAPLDDARAPKGDQARVAVAASPITASIALVNTAVGVGRAPPPLARLASHLARCSVEERRVGIGALNVRVGNRTVAEPASVARAPLSPSQSPPKADPRVVELAHDAIEELDDRARTKVLLAYVLSASKLTGLPAFTAILKSTKHETFGDYFIFLASEFEDSFSTKATVQLFQIFADQGVNVVKELPTFTLEPLAAVAKFKSFAKQFRALVQSGELSKADAVALGSLIAEAEWELRAIEGDLRKPVQAKQMGAAGAAAVAWTTAAALAADDVTVIGIADDVVIPFVVVGAIALSAIAAFSGPKPQILSYGPAKAKVGAALRKMTDLLAISKAMAIQGPRAAGQLGNVAVHLARLLALGAVGGRPSGEPPKKNNRDDDHWWAEIKASLKNFFQATKGASRKQVMRELLKYYSEAEIAEIEAALLRAEAQMGEQIGRILPPP